MLLDSLSTLEATSQAAALYAALGWPVFPVWGLRDGVCCCGKADCRYPGKHPISGRGMKDATVDAATVGRWWAAHPEANIGLATGAASGIFVVDVDAHGGGLDSWADVVGTWPVPPTIESMTGGGGRHLFFLHVAGLRSTTGKLAAGVDTRGEGGYVILPPSSHVSGGTYVWELGAAPGEIELAELPDWLLELLQQPRPAQAPTRARAAAPSANGSHPTTDVERARLYLANLPGGMVDSYAEWISVGLALAELGDEGLRLWDSWSQASDKYKPGECAQKWATFRPAGVPGTVGLGSLAHWAGMTYAATVPTRAGERAPTKQAAQPPAAGQAEGVPPVRVAEELPDVELNILLQHLERGGEAGDGELFSLIYFHRVLFDWSERRWWTWAGHNWQPDATGQVGRLVDGQLSRQYLRAVGSLQTRIVAATEQEKGGQAQPGQMSAAALQAYQDAARKRAARLRDRRGRDAALDFASAILGQDGSQWDAALVGRLACANGVVNMATGVLQPGWPGDYVRTFAPHSWDARAECPRFEKFVGEIFGNDAELAAFVQRWLGYAASGSGTEHRLPIFWGAGRNGKDTLLEAVGYALGPLAGPVSKDAILDPGGRRTAGGAQPHLMSLRGKRLAWANEPKEGGRIDVAQVKLITGGGRITARSLYGQEITFAPTHALALLTNHKPSAPADDFALWARLLLVPFGETFVNQPGPGQRQADGRLGQALRAEAPGILRWLVAGYQAYLAEGLNPPGRVLAETAAYQAEEDIVGQFLAERCIIGTTDTPAAAGELLDAYRGWSGNPRITQQWLGRQLAGRGFEKGKDAATRRVVYHGLTLETSEN